MAAVCFAALDPVTYRPHALHALQRNWPETNCYVDLWIELLSTLGCEPAAALGFTVAQDFEGDQFTFFKFPPEDLAALFGVRVQELAIYDRIESHALEQLRRGRLVLVEVDSFYLPDTRGTSYRATHGKTTIALNRLDSAGRRLQYFHNAGYFVLSGDDFDGIFRQDLSNRPELLFPYIEFVKIETDRRSNSLAKDAIAILARHVQVRPKENPLRAYQTVFAAQLAQLIERPMEFFHLYAFNTLRQCGANFELLGDHLAWLEAQGETGLTDAVLDCREIASGAKSMQFQLARAVSRKRTGHLDGLERLAESYDAVMAVLRTRYA
jgi:hypothetical protein